MRDNAISEITAEFEYRKTGLNHWPLHRDLAGVNEQADGVGDLGRTKSITARQDPDEFAEGRRSQRNQICVAQFIARSATLLGIVIHDGANKYIGVGCDVQRSPAQLRAAISFMSSTDIFRPFFGFSSPKTSSIRPVGAALT